MSTTIVTGTVVDASDVGVGGLVHFRLISSTDGSRPPGIVSGGKVVISDSAPVVDEDGTFAHAVIPNDEITPANTWYEVWLQPSRQPGQRSDPGDVKRMNIVVPVGGGPYAIDGLWIDPPASLPAGALGTTHIGASPAHTALHIGYDPTGTDGKLSSTDLQGAVDELANEQVGAKVWTQADAEPVWNMTHDLGRIPLWYFESSVLNGDGTRDELHPSLEHPSLNLTLADFGAPESGVGYAR